MAIPLFARDFYFTRNGEISFSSLTPIYEIKAENNQVTCVLDIGTGEVSFRIPILGFNFKNGLMQEHFNENYMESDLYPNATFKGKINDWNEVVLTKKYQSISLDGIMTIHGVDKEISEQGNIKLNADNIIGDAIFQIMIVDYGIDIPKIVREKIAKIVDVNVQLTLKKR